jgi:hypothetical protein
MKRVNWLVIVTTAICMIPALMSGCGGSGDQAGDAPPSDEPEITGTITSISTLEGDQDLLGSILVEASDSTDGQYDMASVTVTHETEIYDISGFSTQPVQVGFDALAEGQLVAVVFTGPVAESYPVQARAEYIYLTTLDDDSEDSVDGEYQEILEVKSRHEDELMAINGVVGVGVGERDGSFCIVVYLEEDSEELKSRIPEWVEGFPVTTEVTGPIEAQ